MLTCFTPIKIKMGFAPKFRNSVSRTPSTLPTNNAEEADGIRLRFSTSVIVADFFDEKGEVYSCSS